MDRYFYSVEMDGDRKVVHMSGNVYYIVCDTEKNYRLAEWTFLYLDVKDVVALVQAGEFYDEINSRVNYLSDMTEDEAEWVYRSYHNGTAGVELDIKLVNENTPCGDYWCE